MRYGCGLTIIGAPGFQESSVACWTATEHPGNIQAFIVAEAPSLAQASHLLGHVNRAPFISADERSTNDDPAGIARQCPAVTAGGLETAGFCNRQSNVQYIAKSVQSVSIRIFGLT